MLYSDNFLHEDNTLFQKIVWSVW